MKNDSPTQLFQMGRLEKIPRRGGGFCRIFQKKNNIYVFAGEFDKGTYIRKYDSELNFTGIEKILIPCKGEMLGDHDVTFDGEYLYHFPTGATHPKDTESRERNRGVIYKYETDDFDLIAIGRFKISENELVTDQNIRVINNDIYIGSEYRENNYSWRENRSRDLTHIPPNSKVARGLYLRIFDKGLNFLSEHKILAKINEAAVPTQYWGMGASQLYADGYYCVVAASPIGNTSYFNKGESIGARQIFVIRFDNNFNFVDSKGSLSETDNDNYYPTGSFYENGNYFLSYTIRRPGEGCVTGSPPPPSKEALSDPNPDGFFGENGAFGGDQGNIHLRIFNKNFNKIFSLDITDFKVRQDAITGAAHRSSLIKVGNKIYLGYDDPKSICVRELILNREII